MIYGRSEKGNTTFFFFGLSSMFIKCYFGQINLSRFLRQFKLCYERGRNGTLVGDQGQPVGELGQYRVSWDGDSLV